MLVFRAVVFVVNEKEALAGYGDAFSQVGGSRGFCTIESMQPRLELLLAWLRMAIAVRLGLYKALLESTVFNFTMWGKFFIGWGRRCLTGVNNRMMYRRSRNWN